LQYLMAWKLNHSYTYPIETRNNSLMFGFLHDHKDSVQPSLDNSWEYIERIALQRKMNQRFESWINEIKNDYYIKIF